MNIEDQKIFIINWIKELSMKFENSLFTYSYKSLSDTHVLSISPSELYNDDRFDEERDWMYDNFEAIHCVNLLCIPSNDPLLDVLQGVPEHIISAHKFRNDTVTPINIINLEDITSLDMSNNNYELAA